MPGLISPSALALLGVNLGVAGFALIGDWSLPTILMSYVTQSIIIGLFQAKKMLDLKEFSTEGFKINGQPAEPTPATKRSTVVFFLFHYGIFHAVYAGFVISSGAPDWLAVFGAGAAFFANHLTSYLAHRGETPKKLPNIGGMMFFPYIRIIPMHAFILFGALAAGGPYATAAFLLMKTAADEMMHLIEHRNA